MKTSQRKSAENGKREFHLLPPCPRLFKGHLAA